MAFEFDPTSAKPVDEAGTGFDPSTAEPVKPRGAVAEIANQGYAGIVSDLPKMAGQALQYASDPGKPVYNFGARIAHAAEERGKAPDLQPDEANHGMVVNALAAGARMIPQSIVPAAVVGGALAALPVSPAVALGGAAVLGSLPAAMSTGQETLDKAHEAGIGDDVAIPAARKTALIEGAGETVGTFLGAKLLGAGGKALSTTLNRATGRAVGTPAEQVLGDATSTAVLKPWLKQIPETAIGEVATEMGQNAGEAYVEQQAGIPTHSPWEAAKEAIAPTLGMTALLAPFGLAGFAAGAHNRGKRTELLAEGSSDPIERIKVAAGIQKELAAVDPTAAQNFGAHASDAIANAQPLTIGPNLFQPFTPQAAPAGTVPPGNVPPNVPPGAAPPAAGGAPPATPPGNSGPAAPPYTPNPLGPMAAAVAAGAQWKAIAPTDPQDALQTEREQAGARASRETDARLAGLGKAWQDLGIKDPTDDLQSQKAGFTPAGARGIDPNAGPLSSVAAMAVNAGTSDHLAAQKEESANDIMDGTSPFRGVIPARRAADAQGEGWRVVPVEGGYVVRPTPEALKKAESAGSTAAAKAPQSSPAAPAPKAQTPQSAQSAPDAAAPAPAAARSGDAAPAKTPETQSSAAPVAAGSVAKPLTVGQLPNTAEPVTVKAGVVHIGKYEAVNFETGEPVTVPKGATESQIKQALKDSGALAKGRKFFGGAGDAAVTVDAGAREVATSKHNDKPEPSKEQILGGNAPLGHIKVGRADISVETDAGGFREDKENVPPKWRSEMKGYHYGYALGTTGADSTKKRHQHLDVLVKQGLPTDYNGPVYVINQRHLKGGFDEHKALMGPQSEQEARAAYLAQYEKGWQGLDSVGTFPSVDAFMDWASDPAKTKLPAPVTPSSETTSAVDVPAGTRPANWRSNFMLATQVGKNVGVPYEKGRTLAELLALIDAKDGVAHEPAEKPRKIGAQERGFREQEAREAAREKARAEDEAAGPSEHDKLLGPLSDDAVKDLVQRSGQKPHSLREMNEARLDTVPIEQLKALLQPEPANLVNGRPRAADVKPEESLLLMPCSGPKDFKGNAEHEAREVYQGVMWQTLRTHNPDPGPRLVILSAKYGFIGGDELIAPYDQVIDDAGAAEILSELDEYVGRFEGEDFRDVQIVGGEQYKRVMRAFVAELQKRGAISEDASIREVGGGIGDHRQQLGEYLRGFEPKPTAAAPGQATGSKPAPAGAPVASRWDSGTKEQRAQMLREIERDDLATSHARVQWSELSPNLRATLLAKAGEAMPKAEPKPVTPQVAPLKRKAAEVIDNGATNQGEFIVRDAGTNLARFEMSNGKAVRVKFFHESKQTTDFAQEAIDAHVKAQAPARNSTAAKAKDAAAQTALDQRIRADIEAQRAARAAGEAAYQADAEREPPADMQVPSLRAAWLEGFDKAAPAAKPDKAEIRPYRKPDGSVGYEAVPIATNPEAFPPPVASFGAPPADQRTDKSGRVLEVGDKVAAINSYEAIASWGQNDKGQWVAQDADGATIGRARDLTYADNQQVGTGKAKAAAKPDPLSEAEKAAKAKMLGAAAKLAQLLSKNTRMNITPEQEQAMLPIVIELFEGAMELGYVKFKQAARYVREFIAGNIDQDAADSIPMDTLQGAYIATARRHADKGVTPKAEVITVDSIADLNEPAETPPASDDPEPDMSGWPSNERVAEHNAWKARQKANAAPSDTPAVEKPAAKADTDAKAPDDSAPPRPPAALDTPLAPAVEPGQPAPEQSSRGAAGPRAKPGPADDGGLRAAGERPDGLADESGNLGDGSGLEGVQHRQDGSLAGDLPGVAADWRAPLGGLTREGSWHATAKRNLDIIDLALAIQAEGRQPTPAEQELLSKYVGFGAGEIRNNLFPVPQAYQKRDDPERLIWPDLVRDARWKPLAERAAALPLAWQRTLLQSTQYAHYTGEGVVRSIWSAVQRLGFTGGRVLEPGSGIGSFAMAMPEDLRRAKGYTGLEFDGPTALIAQLLSPQQNMLHEDFIKRKLPRDFFDMAIGNPPFSQTKILGDPDYEKHGFMLHDFFFAKSIDRVRPGGLLVFVTSKGTMDKQSDKARKYLADRADLLGAIRLPQTAFEDNAGTKVVTDVIFLRKRAPGEAPAGQAWGDVKGIETKDGPAAINEYYVANPQMVLGQHRLSGAQDDQGRRISGLRNIGEYTVVSYDTTAAELEAKFAQAVEHLPQNAYSVQTATPETLKQEARRIDFNPLVKREGVVYLAKDGTLMRVKNGVGTALADDVKLTPKDHQWFKGYLGVRDLVQQARAAQVADGDWEAGLKKLNKAYDAFRKEHGPINDFRVQTRTSTDEDGDEVQTDSRIFKNKRLLREDYDSSLMMQLEHIQESGDIVKSPFLLGRTIGKPVSREVKTIGDALAVSLDSLGRLDLDDVAQRIKLPRDEAIEAMGAQIYKAPSGTWQLADEYLAGDVVAKLEEAELAARVDPSLARNVKALKEVQPEKLGPSQISVKLGAGWVPEKHVNDFAREITAGAVTFDPKTESWQVAGANLRSERRAGDEYGTADRSPSELLEAVLNSRTVTIKRTEDKKTVTDQPATTAANEAMRKIRDRFKSWVWTDSERAADVVDLYNQRYNNIAPRRFDGSHLTLPGVSLRFAIHPHQLRAIWRQIQTGNTYLAHAVGAGKTIEMIAGAMEQKRLGLINKPIFAVPNHMLEQFANEFMELYPLANVMVADDENFSAERRRAFVAAATLNAPDAIIITHSAFERIGVKEESVAPIRDEILAELQAELDDVEKGDRVRRSQLEQQIEAVTQRFDSIVGAGKKDSTVTFEEMGVDFVYADEAHAFRKLDFSTNQKVKGIDPNGSRRALDMYVKTRILERRRPNRSMVWASGTPVTNTMGELFTIMRFFAPDELARAGIATFDGWARQFGEAVPSLEANAAGRYETVVRFAKFDNVPELMSRVRQFMDVLTSDQLGALVKRPDIEGGKPNLVMVEGTDALKGYMRTVLLPRLEASRAWKPSRDEPFNPDPVIAITSDGRFAALDPRFFGAKIDETTPTKLNSMADAIALEYTATLDNVYFADREKSKAEKVKGSTQIVFYNLGFGVQSQTNRGFNARQALTKRLVERGVKRDHILWFDDANTDAKKEAAFKAMRSGEARILIGSAKKMGTGVNVQKRLSMLHYFDPPWYPSDVEQPHGRIIRQGNQNERVRINWYATKGTYDSTMWQMVGRKQRFIDQAFTGDKNIRSMDDMSEAGQYEQAAAMASGDPRAIQLAGLRQDVERLERLQAAHASEQISVRSSLRHHEWYLEAADKSIAHYSKASDAVPGGYLYFNDGRVGSARFSKPGEFGTALKDAFNRVVAERVLDPSERRSEVAQIGGLPVMMQPLFERTKKEEDAKPTGTFGLYVQVGPAKQDIEHGLAGMGADVDAAGLTRRIVNAVNDVSTQLDRAKRDKVEHTTEATRLRKKLGAPFEYQQEMLDKYNELKALEDQLRAEGAAVVGGADYPAGRYEVTSPEGVMQVRDLTEEDIGQLLGHKWKLVAVARNIAQMGSAEANETEVVFDGAFSKTADHWYSELASRLEALPMKAAPAQAWLDHIAGMKGVKPDEVEWSGIREWLQTQPGRIPKEQVLAFLDANGVKVTETVKGAKGKNDPINQLDDLVVRADALGYTFDRHTFGAEGGDYFTRQVIFTRRSDGAIFQFNPSRNGWEQIDADGLPEGDAVKPDAAMTAIATDVGQLAQDETEEIEDPDDTRYNKYTLPGGENYREILLTLPTSGSQFQTEPAEGGNVRTTGLNPAHYYSNHWDEPNILAHIRLNERVDADGKRVLFVEEIQSDWAQQGRKKGFAGRDTTGWKAKAPADLDQGLWHVTDADGRFVLNVLNAANEAEAIRAAADSSAAPKAPFVGKTDAWVTLALKRIVKLAVDEGFDKVAFVSGKQSADRYNLRKQIERIKVTHYRAERGEVTLEAFKAGDEGGAPVIFKQGIQASELDDYIGKELAAKARDQLREHGMAHIKGAELEVGGEGMISFYDKIVPKNVNELLKKLGGGKVGKVELQIPGQRAGGTDTATGAVIGPNGVAGQNLDAPGFDITQDMREAAGRGMALFSKPATASQRAADQASGLMERSAIDKAISELTRNWLRKPQIHVIDSMADAPEHMRAEYSRQGATGKVHGFFYQGDVWLVADAMGSEADVQKVLFHEALGHFGLRGFFGRALNPMLEELIGQRKNQVARKARSYGLDMAKGADRLLAAEEVLTELAQTRPELPLVQRLIATVRSWLREHVAAFRNLELTDAEIINRFILPARGFVERGTSGKTTFNTGGAFAKELRTIQVDGQRRPIEDSNGRPVGQTFQEQLAFWRAYGNGPLDEQGRPIAKEQPGAFLKKSLVTGQPIANTWQNPDASRLDDVIYSMQDKHVDTRRVVQKVRAAIGALNDEQDPYLQEELYHGRAAMATKEFLEKSLRPLLNDLQARGVELSDFEEYLHNRHAEARNIQVAKVNPRFDPASPTFGGTEGSGINTADARAYLAGLTPAKRADFQALAVHVDQINRDTRALLVSSGLEKQTTIDAWHTAYGDEYVPLQREEMDNGTTGIGQGFSVRGAASKRALGSDKPVANILANIALQREKTITRAEKRKIGEALYGMVLKAPNDAFWFAIDPKLQQNPGQLLATAMQLISMGLDPVDAEAIAREPTQSYIDPVTKQVAQRINPALRGADNVLAVRIDGEDKYVFFNKKDPRAMRMAHALKNLDADQLGVVMGTVAKMTRYFAAINTQYNPIFGVTNIARDLQTALLNLNSTPLKNHKGAVMKHVLSALRGIYIDLRDHRAGRMPTSAWAQTFEEFQREGGATGYRDMYANAGERAEALTDELAAIKHGKLRGAGKGIMGWLSDYNEAMENAVRVSAYKVGKEQGLTNQQAASLAKNLTVNFNRKGQVALQAGALYAFFNASAQGTARIAETLFKDGKLTSAGKTIIAGGIALGTMQALLLSAAGFDDDEPPDFVRERSLVIPTSSSTYVSIPMPLGFHILPNLGRIPAEWVMSGFKNTPKRIGQLVGLVFDAFNPLGSAGLSLQTLTPTIIDPLAALAENKEFSGKPIARLDFDSLHPTAGFTRARDTATPWARLIAWGMNELTGGTDHKPGLISPTPDQIDYLVGQGFGGVGREVGKLAQVVSTTLSGEELPTHKIPLVGRFVGTTDGQAAESSRFYNNLRELGLHKVEIDGLRKAGKGAELRQYVADNPAAALYPLAEKLHSDVSKLHSTKRALIDKGTPSNQVRFLDARATALMKTLNDKMREVEHSH